MINNNVSNVADIFALWTLGMMFGGNPSTIDYSKIGETLKRVVTNKGSDNDIAELATALNIPADKVQDAVNNVIKQLNKNQFS